MSTPSQATAERWNRSLRHFRFHFAHGGHANDMDRMVASIAFEPGEPGLLALFSKLGVTLQRIPDDKPRRVVGRSFNSADWEKYADPIACHPAYESPSFVRLFGMPVHLAVRPGIVDITITGADGDPWSVTERDFKNALALEALLPTLGIAFVA